MPDTSGPLDPQTAAPPSVPPRRPRVAAAMADHDDHAERIRELQALITTIRLELDATIASLNAGRGPRSA